MSNVILNLEFVIVIFISLTLFSCGQETELNNSNYPLPSAESEARDTVVDFLNGTLRPARFLVYRPNGLVEGVCHGGVFTAPNGDQYGITVYHSVSSDEKAVRSFYMTYGNWGHGYAIESITVDRLNGDGAIFRLSKTEGNTFELGEPGHSWGIVERNPEGAFWIYSIETGECFKVPNRMVLPEYTTVNTFEAIGMPSTFGHSGHIFLSDEPRDSNCLFLLMGSFRNSPNKTVVYKMCFDLYPAHGLDIALRYPNSRDRRRDETN